MSKVEQIAVEAYVGSDNTLSLGVNMGDDFHRVEYRMPGVCCEEFNDAFSNLVNVLPPEIAMETVNLVCSQTSGPRLSSTVGLEGLLDGFKAALRRFRAGDVKMSKKAFDGRFCAMLEETILKDGWMSRNLTLPVEVSFTTVCYSNVNPTPAAYLAEHMKLVKQFESNSDKFFDAYGKRCSAISKGLSDLFGFITNNYNLTEFGSTIEGKLDSVIKTIKASPDPRAIKNLASEKFYRDLVGKPAKKVTMTLTAEDLENFALAYIRSIDTFGIMRQRHNVWFYNYMDDIEVYRFLGSIAEPIRVKTLELIELINADTYLDTTPHPRMQSIMDPMLKVFSNMREGSYKKGMMNETIAEAKQLIDTHEASAFTKTSNAISIGNEGFVEDLFKKIESKIKSFSEPKFGSIDSRKFNSYVDAVKDNIEKTIANKDWVEKHYSANGSLKIKTGFIGKPNEVKADNWIDKLATSPAETRKFAGGFAGHVKKCTSELDKLVERAIKAGPGRISIVSEIKKLPSIEDYFNKVNYCGNIHIGEKFEAVVTKDELEVNCPSPEYLVKLGEIYIDAIEADFSAHDDMVEAAEFVEQAHTYYDALIEAGFDEVEVEMVYDVASENYGFFEDYPIPDLPLHMFVGDTIEAILNRGKKK